MKLNLIFEVKWNRNALANDTADADDSDADADDSDSDANADDSDSDDDDDVPGKLSDSEAENFR